MQNARKVLDEAARSLGKDSEIRRWDSEEQGRKKQGEDMLRRWSAWSCRMRPSRCCPPTSPWLLSGALLACSEARQRGRRRPRQCEEPWCRPWNLNSQNSQGKALAHLVLQLSPDACVPPVEWGGQSHSTLQLWGCYWQGRCCAMCLSPGLSRSSVHNFASDRKLSCAGSGAIWPP